MKQAIWSRVGPVTGILFLALVFTGFSIHGYPAMKPTDSQLAKWLAGIDLTTYRVGIYLHAAGDLLFIPFAAWLYVHLRQGARNSSWPEVAMFAAGAAWVSLTLPIEQVWLGMVEQARNGLDIQVAQTVVSINQAWFEMTAIVLGLSFVAAGVAITRGGAMSRWAGWVAIIIGVGQVVSWPFGSASTPAQLLAYLSVLAVAGYYTFRPARAREPIAGTAQQSLTTGLPATR